MNENFLITDSTLPKENWLRLVDFPNYAVSDLGRVFSLYHMKELKYEITKDGYKRVSLSADGVVTRFLVHKLVADLFVPNPDNLPLIDHKDRKKLNCQADNLRWATYSMNERNKGNKRIDSYDKETGIFIQQYACIQEAVEDLFQKGITENVGAKAHICSCCKGRVKNVYGRLWSYAE